MIKIVNKKIDVNTEFPQLVGKVLFYFQEKQLIALYQDASKRKSNYKFEKIKWIREKKHCILIYENDGVYILNEDTLCLNLYWKSRGMAPFCFDENFIYEFFWNDDDEIFTIYFYDYRTEELLWKNEYKGFCYFREIEGYMFYLNGNEDKVIRLNHLTGKEIWRFNFTEGEKFKNKFFIHKNALIVMTEKGDIFDSVQFIRALDIETGEVLWATSDFSTAGVYSSLTGCIHAVGGNGYYVLSADTGKLVLEKEFPDQIDDNIMEIVSNKINIIGDGMYFIYDIYINEINKFYFGKINIITHELELLHPINLSEGIRADAPLYFQNKIYIHDSENKMHIFELD